MGWLLEMGFWWWVQVLLGLVLLLAFLAFVFDVTLGPLVRRWTGADDVTTRRVDRAHLRKFHAEDITKMEAQGLPVWKPDPGRLPRKRRRRWFNPRGQ